MRSKPSTREQDNRVLLVFVIFAILLMAIPAAALISEKTSVLQLIGVTLSGLSIAFVLSGLPSIYYNRKHGLLSRRRFWRWSVIIALAGSIAVTAITLIANALRPDLLNLPPEATSNMAIIIPSLVFGFFVAALITLLSGLMLAFGGIAVMVAIARRLTPWILIQIVEADPARKPTVKDRAIRWLFNIPEVLDTRTLKISPLKTDRRLRWSDVRLAIQWELFFGAILAIYISFNPFISDRSTSALLGIFGILISGSVLIPLLILPWQVFRRLDACIEGPRRSFTLYTGVRSRLLQSYLAIGTLVILVRLAISTIDVEAYLLWFAAFLAALLWISLTFTFVYFNYFEEQLVEDISRAFESRGSAAQNQS